MAKLKDNSGKSRRSKSTGRNPRKKSPYPKTRTESSSNSKKSPRPTFDYPNVYKSGEENRSRKSKESGKSKSGKLKKTDHANPEKKMSFLEHLEELRWMLFRSIVAILLGMIICYLFSNQIVQLLRKPAPADMKLIFLGPTEGFMIYLKVAMFAGIVLSLPYIVYEFWKFVVPGLLEKEKKVVMPIVFYTVLCFMVGAAFAYFFIIPFAMRFLLSYQDAQLIATITIGKYLGFVVTLILCFGAVFELPVLSFLLTYIGILTPQFLVSKRRYGIVLIFILAAILTPPDVFTQMCMAIPLIVLYEISIIISKIVYESKQHGPKHYSKRPWTVTLLCWFFILTGFCSAGAAVLSRHYPSVTCSIFAYLPLDPAYQFYTLLIAGLAFVGSGWLALYRINAGRWAGIFSFAAVIIAGYYYFGPILILIILSAIFVATTILFMSSSAKKYYVSAQKRKIK